MGLIMIKPSVLFNAFALVSIFGVIADAKVPKVYTSRISQHLNQACKLFADKVDMEGGRCNQLVIYDTLDELEDIKTKPDIDLQMIDVYIKEAEEGKLCYSPDAVIVANLRNGCEAMEIICVGQKEVWYCSLPKVYTSRISQHRNQACKLFADKVDMEGGRCNQLVIYDTLDELEDIKTKPDIDLQMIDVYIKEAEEGKLCYSPDAVIVANLRNGCEAMEIVCEGQKNVWYCSNMALVMLVEGSLAENHHLPRDLDQINRPSAPDVPHQIGRLSEPDHTDRRSSWGNDNRDQNIEGRSRSALDDPDQIDHRSATDDYADQIDRRSASNSSSAESASGSNSR